MPYATSRHHRLEVTVNSKPWITVFTAFLTLLPSLSWADGSLFQARYEVINLGSLGGSDSSALSVNDFGTVVGWSTTAGGQRHAFLYNNGTMTDIGTLIGGTASEAHAISDQGVVVGMSGINGLGAGFPEIDQGFTWQQGKMTSAGALYCPCSFNVRYGASDLIGVNDSGRAVGWSETVRGSWVLHGMSWQNGGLQDLGGGAGDWSISHMYAINDAGQVVGDYAQDAGKLGTTTFDRQAALWQSDGTRQILGLLPGYTTSVALGINAGGDVVGWSGTADGSQSHAFLWRNGAMQDLGVLPGYATSRALGVNGRDQVVGWCSSADSSVSHAFLWFDGRMHDLNDLVRSGSGWVLQQAAGINVLGQIVGTGIFNGQISAYMLRPIYVWGFPAQNPIALSPSAAGSN